MTPDEALAVIHRGETLTTEFKRARKNDLNDDEIVEAAVCIANGQGGMLFLGVDNKGQIDGLSPRHGPKTDPSLLQALITNRTEPPLATHVEILELDSLPVAIVDIPKSDFPIGTVAGRYVRRTLKPNGEPQCVPFPLHAMLAQAHSARGSDYAATLARGASFTDLDPQEFARFRHLCSVSKGDVSLGMLTDHQILRALRLSAPEDPELITLGAILLFGTSEALERYVPTHEVIFQELRGGDILTSETFRYPLLKAAEKLYGLVEDRNPEQELMLGLLRVGVPRVPNQVIRETIANALTHRDFARLGPISVQLDENQLRVANPGGFPPGITLDNLLDSSNPRSPIIADTFKRAGVVDRAGRGIREIYEDLLRSGRGEPDYSQTTSEQVVVRIPTSDSDLELVRFIVDFENSNETSLGLGQLRVLHDLKNNGPETISELSSSLGTSLDFLRATLAGLVGQGLLESQGVGRSRRYMLTATFYRIAGSDEYARLQDTDPLQQEQLILTYVQRFGSINRAKAASLCHLSPQQAGSVLKQMRHEGKLEMHGQRRGSRYELPTNKSS
ncbi:MAG: RNA-binding domain-containing protein [Scrofimicrobium sp.]